MTIKTIGSSSPEEAGMMMALLERALRHEIIRLTKKLDYKKNTEDRNYLKLEIVTLIKMMPAIELDFVIKSY